MTKPTTTSRLQFLDSANRYLDGYTVIGARQDCIDVCLEYGYDAHLGASSSWGMVGLDHYFEPSVEALENTRVGAEAFVDAGVDVWMETTVTTVYASDYLYPTVLPTAYQCYPTDGNTDYLGIPLGHSYTKTNLEGYESLYGACFDYWEELGPHFKGYNYECTFDVFSEWFRDRTTKPISYNMIGNPTFPCSLFHYNEDTLDERLAQVDQVEYSFFHQDDLATQTPWMTYIQDTYPDMPLGCNFAYIVEPATAWGPTLGLTDIISVADQKSRLRTAMLGVKAVIGNFDFTNPYFRWRPSPDIGYDTIEDQVKFYNELALTSSGNKNVWNMQSMGLPPYYSGASICVHNSPKTDTFANTGNEIILLKDYAAASTLGITVTSTDTLTREDYTLALSPDRGTFIGPYPLDEYGALPTITYDNTNLYVSILKDKPYSPLSGGG